MPPPWWRLMLLVWWNGVLDGSSQGPALGKLVDLASGVNNDEVEEAYSVVGSTWMNKHSSCE